MIKRTAFFILLLSIFGWGSPSARAASGSWQIAMTVSTPYSPVPGGMIAIPLVAGTYPGASNGYDQGLDIVSFLQWDSKTPLQVHLTHGTQLKDTNGDGAIDGWGCPNPETGYNLFQCSLWRDYRPWSATAIWNLEVISSLNQATIGLDWNVEGDLSDLANLEIQLVDLDTAAAPPLPPLMTSSSHYEYTNAIPTGLKYAVHRFEVRVQTKTPMILPPVLPSGTRNAPYQQDLHLAGGSLSTWSLDEGDLPPGVSLVSDTGAIQGTPSGDGLFSFWIRATDAVTAAAVRRDYSLWIAPSLGLTPIDLPPGDLYASYEVSLPTTGGMPPYVWTLESGTIPEGLSLDSGTGSLSGSLQIPGLFNFDIQVSDSNGGRAVQSYAITVREPSDLRPPDGITDLMVLYGNPLGFFLAWTAPSDDSVTGTASAYDLRYAATCPSISSTALDEAWWDTAAQATGEPRPQAGTYHTFSLPGLDPSGTYCVNIRSLDSNGHLSNFSNWVLLPDPLVSNPGSAQGMATTQWPLQQGFNLVSFPGNAVPNDLSVLEDDLGRPVALYRWYSPYPTLIPPQWYLEDRIQPGYGYFVYATEAFTTVDIPGLPIQDAQVVINLQAGWNMVGNPYPQDIPLRDIQIRDAKPEGHGLTKSLEESARLGWVGNAFYAFTGYGYNFIAVNEDPAPVMRPGTGYWFYISNSGTYEMIVRKPLP